ncbi:phosphotransferase [Paenibacillus sp. SYP-B3998]|uniref:Phosphotransferase n=1 Tax=Paenibacillus sp. SYP-B3998 TaxID=2678564 RepID=A0A6G3ZU49_9BACL|nr:phosphotransferase [Paenibacillus sp. SYP-B3998]NEW05733.1 phosphotransferase [Paenibacillus sp. SYP-B3998]
MDRPRLKRRFSSIVRQYGLRYHKIYSCRSLYKKAAAYQVFTNKGKLFLKPFNGPKARLDRVYSQIVWLKKHHFQNMPQWFKTSKGKHYVKNNGRLYYVSEWIQGSQLGGNEQDYERIGEILAQLHLISRRSPSVSPSFSMKEINRFHHQHQMFLRHLPTIRKKRQGIGNWFREQGDQCVRLAEEAWNTLLQSDVQRVIRMEKPSLIHGDVTHPNIIVSSESIYLLDWEFTRRGSAYYEVAKTLNNITNFSVPNINALLVGYEKRHPLKPEERLILASFFRLPREVWIAARQIRFGIKAPNFKRLKDSWPNRLEAIQWMDLWAREQPQEPQESQEPQELQETQEPQEPCTAPVLNEEENGVVDTPPALNEAEVSIVNTTPTPIEEGIGFADNQ